MNIIELFSGCGGLGYGFHKYFNITVANDIDKDACLSYKKNFPDTKIIHGDITEDKTKERILKHSKEIVGIIGGVPCVAYSLSGLRDPSDPRGKLFKEYVDIVKQLKPEFIVIENVVGILTMKQDRDDLDEEEIKDINKIIKLEQNINILKQKKKHNKSSFTDNDEKDLKKYIRKYNKIDQEPYRELVMTKIKRAFEELGYNIDYKVHKAVEFGCPQKRERVIIIGMLNHTPSFPKSNTDVVKTVRDAIEDLEDAKEDYEFSHIFTKHSKTTIEKIKKVQQGESLTPKFKEANYRCYYDQPSSTVKENHGGVFLHPVLDRSMTPRELARLQTFPDDFTFIGSKKAILCQIGNAVPCLLAEAIAKHIREVIN